MSDSGHDRWDAVAGVELLDEYGGPPTGHEDLAAEEIEPVDPTDGDPAPTTDPADGDRPSAGEGAGNPSADDITGSPTEADEPTIPGDWTVAVDETETKHLVGGEWELFAGRGTTVDRRDEWWLNLERDGEPVLSGHKIRVGAGDAPWNAISAVLGRYR